MLAPLVFAALVASSSTGLATVRYDAPPPNFAIRGPHGTEYLSDLRGRVVVIDFWATWCDVCTAEMHDFVRAKARFGNRVAIVTISNELHDVAASYFRQWNIDLPLVEDLNGSIFRTYSISKIPVTLVLDPVGNVAYVSLGGLSWDELARAIEQAEGGSNTSTRGPGVLQ